MFDERLDDREAVSGKFVVFRGVGIIEGPLLERDISADEVQEPANSFVLFLNYSKSIEYNVIHSNDQSFGCDVFVVITLYQKGEVIAFLF